MKKWLAGLACVGLCMAAWGQATLPTSFSGPDWKTAASLPEGWTSAMGNDYGANYDGEGGVAGGFRATGQALTIHFSGTATSLSYWLRHNKSGLDWAAAVNEFKVEESVDGATWTDLRVFSATEVLPSTATMFTDTPSASAQYIRFVYTAKGSDGGNVGIDGVTVAGASGPAVFSIGLTPDADFTVNQGDSATVVAAPRNAEGDVTYTWSVEPVTGGSGSGDTFTIDSSVLGHFTVTCAATDGVSSASNSVGFTVVEPGAEPDLLITFDATSSSSPGYTATSFTSDGVLFDVLRCYGGDSAVDGKALRIQYYGTAQTNGYIKNAEAFEAPISRVSFDYKVGGSGSAHLGKDWTLQVSTDGEAWETVATVTTATDWQTADAATIPAGAFYFRITGSHTGSANFLLNVDNVAFWFGEPVFGVSISGVAEGERIPQGVETSLTGIAGGGTGPYSYSWDGGTLGTAQGETFIIPGTTATGSYTVTLTATDEGSGGEQVSDSVSFSIDPLYSITVSSTSNGTVTPDVTTAMAGEEVSLAIVPAEGYTLQNLQATWSGGQVTVSNQAFFMPAGDVTISATFRQVQDSATLPFEWHGPWRNTLVDGMSAVSLGTDYSDGNFDKQDNGAAAFSSAGAMLSIRFNSEAATLAYYIRGQSISGIFSIRVQESVTGQDGTWTDVAVYTTGNLSNATQIVTNDLSSGSRYVRFWYETKDAGNFGIDGIVISAAGGSGGSSLIVVSGNTTGVVGEEMELALTVSTGETNFDDWILNLKDPNGVDLDYYFASGNFAFTPELEGAFILSVDAGVASSNITLMVTAVPVDVPIPEVTFDVTTGNFSFEIPSGFSGVRLQGSMNLVVWADLVSGTDYSITGGQVTILTGVADVRLIRVYWQQ
ncbi:MAG: hypothetical protein LBN38_05710 [Verrucomicrobiota bacterium]|nr:hypothetical protein [Verrucomicrobiota bacterium]